ncbi:globin domain-containing protein [Streptomyces sp. H27-D2]|uniref:globin domain-containing protein n=1 Tax=Streptomyces sp. H27-D2 TaxID=3046304 RepID=UPI002DBC87B3|nr:globin domain-containing protein [Streptomyces sp. H27-D2]MEC4015776.1 globin domain-containing protein [Streptomyces sp. H27-D2]
MDAPTTSSADNGTSGGNSGDWGWFSTAKKPTESQPQGQDEQERIPSRPVSSIRPVGTGATRGRTAPEPAPPPAAPQQEAPQQSVPPQSGPAQETARREPAPPRQPAAAQRQPQAAPREQNTQQEARYEPTAAHESAAPYEPVAAPEPTAAHKSAAPYEPVAAPEPERTPPPQAVAPPAQAATPAASQEPAPLPQAPAPPREPAAPRDDASPDTILIRRTLAEIEPIADKVTSYFYALLFVQHPALRELFPAAMDTQRDRLFQALLTAAKHADNAEVLTDYLSHLGRGHRKYGTRAEHYPAVGECLIGALTRYAPETWSPAAEAAWVRVYTAISQIMIDSAAASELTAPPWWQAEVVSHDLRTADIAVVTVRPDQPYPFLAGQYTSLETPWWPRVWRHYSFSAAPRSDGLLSFHVKAIPAGWVSNALVHRARPGDIVRLGAPAGSMTVDHSTDDGLLCLGGGTGIAPIKALVEDVAEYGRKRPVEVFYGARSDHDLYDIDTMLRLQKSHSWLSVRPVVSDGPTLTSLTGRLPDAVRRYGPWNAYDAYLSGPPGMIRSGVTALVGAGIPSHRIRHDSIEELVAAGE